MATRSAALASSVARPARISLKEQQLLLRESAIIDAVHVLLAEKGYDLMTVDEVAAQVGIAKTSLYKHFESKEALAAAAMVRLLEQTLAVIDAQPDGLAPLVKLKAVVRWALELHLRRQMPVLPSTRSVLRDALSKNKSYIDRLLRVSDRLGGWIEAAQAAGGLRASIPSDLILFTLFAGACDPVADFLQASGRYQDSEIVELMLSTCFDGLAQVP